MKLMDPCGIDTSNDNLVNFHWKEQTVELETLTGDHPNPNHVESPQCHECCSPPSSKPFLWGVRAQNINIGGGVGGEIPDQNRLQYALQHIHGIGRSKAHHIVCELGVENKYVRDLSKRELYSLRELLSKKSVLKEMWGGWWAFSATEASGMSMAYPVEASKLIPMPAPGRAGLLGGEQDEDEYCCL
ncbi:hypothetical protein AHAS_Ahas19G0140300 [Arachis hypogaea]